MLKNYLIENPLADEEIGLTLKTALPDDSSITFKRIERGSTNLLFAVTASTRECVLKISHRPDRIAKGTLDKEAKILQKLDAYDFALPIPKILWHGRTPGGLPALLENKLSGERAEILLDPNVKLDLDNAARRLGKFIAELHEIKSKEISEFEQSTPVFPNFPAMVHYWLPRWQPLLEKATHASQAQIGNAIKIIEKLLPLFSDVEFPFVHADVNFENLHGKTENGQLLLTGLCDFENVQTAPPEYDFATIDDNLFLFRPQMEKPFYESYSLTQPLPPYFHKRLRAACLFRALRFIKRSVAYNELHYFKHDRQFLEKWLEANEKIN